MGIIHQTLDFIRAHEAWAVPFAFILAFGESLAVVSLVLPSSAILLGVGALIGAGALEFWPILIAAGLGAFFGDWLSFWIGLRWGPAVLRIWPLSRYPNLLAGAERFFARWGLWGVFIGRFLGPLRATVPLAAGLARMKNMPFQCANFSSAFLWALGLLAPGAFGVAWLEHLWS